ATRVDVQHTVPFAYFRSMRMSGDDGVNTGRGGLQGQGVEVVQYVDERLAGTQHFGLAKRRCPNALVVVASHGRHRCNARQLLEDIGVADVAGVNDEVAAAHRVQGLGTQQSMRVRNQTDANFSGHRSHSSKLSASTSRYARLM